MNWKYIMKRVCMAEKVKGHCDCSKSQSEVITITILSQNLFDCNELSPDLKGF